MTVPDAPIPPAAAVPFAVALGLLLGSFANVLIHRLPLERSILWPGSRCPGCETPIRWYDNIPVVSWLVLGGRCRRCRAAIPWSYPAVEAAGGALVGTLAALHGVSLRWAALSWLAISILALVPIDQRHGILPDRITLPGIIAGLAFAFVTPIGPLRAALGAACGAAVPIGIRVLYGAWSRLRHGPATPEEREDPDALREGMGLGDVKMLAMVGAFLGPAAVLLTIVLGSMIGTLVVAPRLVLGRIGLKNPVPFGPFLGMAAIVALFWGDRILTWYLDLALPAM